MMIDDNLRRMRHADYDGHTAAVNVCLFSRAFDTFYDLAEGKGQLELLCACA